MDIRARLGESHRLRTLAATVILAVVLTAFGLSPARASDGLLVPPHSDSGLDTDADARWDYLVVSVNVDVSVAGGFILVVQLMDGTGTTNIANGQALVDLQGGPNVVDVRIPGYPISQSGIDGPYQARIILLNDTFAFLDIGVHLTAGYLATDFEPVPASIRPPHSDVGVDTDGDLQFDYLAVDVNLDVAQGGVYTVNAALSDSPPTTWIAFARNTTSLAVGPAIVRLRFGGADIRASGINGPYEAQITLLDAAGQTIETGLHTTGTYFISDFDPLDGFFAPPHASFVIDLDGDLFYDYLVVNSVVTVAVAGYYTLDATIPAIPLFTTARTYLSAGTHIVQLDFLGVDLFNGGVDGPYTIDLTLRDDRWRAIDADTHTTGTYFAVDFEPSPPARWVPPTTDSGRDDQPDGFLDSLLINATVDVARTAPYSWTAELWDSTFTNFITAASGEGDLARGLNTIQIRVPGLQVFMAGFDGPYGVDLYLYDEEGRMIDLASYTTGAYLAADFQPPPAQLSPPYMDLPLDRDGDTVLDVIAIDVPVSVTVANTFVLTGFLIDSSFMPVAFNQMLVDLNPGLTTSRLLFSAADAFRTGQDGAFLAFLSLGVLVQGDMIGIDNDQFITRNYTVSSFDRGAPVKISGRITAVESGAGVDGAGVTLWSPVLRVQRESTADASGYYEMWVPKGDYIVLADSSSRNAMAVSRFVTSDTVVDFPLAVQPANAIDGAIRLSAWDRGVLSGNFTIEADVAATRLQIDAGFGDGDGVASQAELDRLLQLGGSPSLPATMRDMFTVDGVTFDRLNGTESVRFTGAGPVVSALPLTGSVSAEYAASGPIAQVPSHLVRFLADYDGSEQVQAYAADWPALYALGSFDPAAGVTIGGIGASTATIDPGVDPNPRDFVRDVWVNMTVVTTDATPPAVTNAALNGQASLRARSGPDVTVTATASDAGFGDWTIAGANFTRGAGNWATVAPMSASDGAFDEVTEDVTGSLATAGFAEGAYSICVYAWDVVPNNDATGACAGLVIDDTPPVVSNVRIGGLTTRTVVVGTSVTLTATASDAAGGGSPIAEANYTRNATTWPGTLMSASDGAFDEVTEDVTATVDTTGWAAGTYDLCVYAKDSVGNDDTSATACAQLIVIDQDVTLPTANAGPDQAVDEDTLVTFDASGSSDNVGVDNYTWTFTDGVARTLYGVGATYTFASPGTYLLTLTVRDAAGNEDTDTLTVTVADVTPPSVAISSPSSGTAVSGVIPVLFTATDNVAVVRVELRVDGALVATDTTAPFELDLDAAGYSDGPHTIRVTAYDAAGLSAYDERTVSVSNPPAGGLGVAGYALIGIAVVAAVAVVAFLLWSRRKRTAPRGMPPAAPPATAPPPGPAPEAPRQPSDEEFAPVDPTPPPPGTGGQPPPLG